ncbi:YesL family protein [Evansella sp. AB-rgal1]|uniref:YesL family protein n=1 Tax=Evansella sp. AB-rgal1 TaxID=3242696 RepID=UPI00359D8456
MQMGGLMGGFYRVSEWIMRLAYVNLLWILFTTIGLFFFGFMPASIAMFTILRKWILGEFDIPVFKTFFGTFKTEFIKGNIFGLVILIIGYILYIDLQYLSLVEGTLHTVLLAVLFLAGILYLTFTFYIIPVYVHYDLKLKEYFKFAILIGITNFHITILMAVGIAALYYIFMRVPGLIPFFSVSVTGLYIMWLGNLAFRTLVSKKEKYEQKQKEKAENASTNE